VENKLGMYHLVFLSHMAFNILEYAKSQLVRHLNSHMPLFLNPLHFTPIKCCGMIHLTLSPALSHVSCTALHLHPSQEWMSDSLSKSFYNGKPNPFEV
jgi:hypothetical protein